MSPRPKRQRRIGSPPKVRAFKPLGLPVDRLETISVQYDEYEAFKLCDYQNLSQEEAARRLNVSRPTLTRIYESVRKKIATAFVEGKMLVIEGGDVSLEAGWFRCNSCHHTFFLPDAQHLACERCSSEDIEDISVNLNSWRERRMAGNAHRAKECICINCGKTVMVEKGVPCKSVKCPHCQQSRLMRKNLSE